MFDTSRKSRQSQDARRTWVCQIRMKAVATVFAVGAAFGLVSAVEAPLAYAESSCPDYLAVGVPGSNQGFDDMATWKAAGFPFDETLYGEQVYEVLTTLKSELPAGSVSALPVLYPAQGVDGIDPAAAKLAYNFSVYKMSKDKGYAAAYALLDRQAKRCSSTKFFLVGYSQGAHIAADLAQTVFHEGSPVDRTRIAGVALLADPGYNGSSPRATEFIYTDDKLAKDPDHWRIHGALGARAEFDKADPVISICIYGDPICDNNSVGAGGLNAKAAADKAWMHGLYTGHNYGDSKSLAQWLGQEIAGRMDD
ncbi:cutinase family protein (plasmid) [Rhodococcus pyridinivorans]|uniref:cutinase family protein n=1 Tax=Rhodococcus pyridinivorans TaxID=103816 RepID=UPI0021640594|nr:cutinase family protein [Rhodococcus pyridinivorans]UVT27723.1 cutinase family protein [Rhodococcus pyridinivorans]